MGKIQLLIAGMALGLSSFSVRAQQANPAALGSVKGILRDTVHAYPVKSATLAVYKADSTLINYQLSNNYGEFVFKNLPLNTRFYLEVSYLGYRLLRQNFSLSGTETLVDLKTLVLTPQDIELNEVKIGIPPIVMNGDTLEFNASAFKLDSNAVVEDLLRKIPNVTLWGDGQITVNGREVKSLLVNGKEFFGGDFKMATQNISKNAVEKVQVYNVQKDKKNPLDSTLTVNLKLKKGTEVGHFGKIGGGYGTGERYESDGSLNFFTPKLQLGFIGASNNINKIANNVRTLAANSTFKGVGTNVEYQPDFRTTGISRTDVGGATFTYNFIEKPTYQKKSVLTANYFLQNRDNNNISAAKTTTTIGAGNQIVDRNNSTTNTLNTNQTFDSRYELGKQPHQLTLTQSASLNTGETNSQALRNATNQQNVLTSTNNTQGQNSFSNKSFSFGANYQYSNYVNYRKKIRNYNARYNLMVRDNDNDRTDITEFRSFVNPALGRNFNRKYTTAASGINQQMFLELPQLKQLFFGDKNLGNFDFGLSNDLVLNHSKNDNQVDDFDAVTGRYAGNGYLSNTVQTNVIQETPALTLSKSYYKGLSNRYDKDLSFSVSAKQKFSYQGNRSDKAFQNIDRSYSNFTPTASIQYYVNQYGEFYNNVSLNFNTDVDVPTLDQLAPLTDSTNVYRLQKGNIHLSESVNRRFSLDFSHDDQHGKNALNYSFTVSFTTTKNAIADSSFIDDQNRRTVFLTNADGAQSISTNGNLRKALKFKNGSLQTRLAGSANWSKTPGYINNAFSTSDNLNTNTNLTFTYTYKDKLAAEAKEDLTHYRSRQDAFNTRYTGTNTITTFSGSYNLTPKFTLNSNVNLNSNASSGSKAIHYNIWNASAIYRFLKGSNAEIKLSALDLLHQNNSVTNTVSANSFTLGTRNVLQHYFMTTVSYYPRQFGKGAVKK